MCSKRLLYPISRLTYAAGLICQAILLAALNGRVAQTSLLDVCEGSHGVRPGGPRECGPGPEPWDKNSPTPFAPPPPATGGRGKGGRGWARKPTASAVGHAMAPLPGLLSTRSATPVRRCGIAAFPGLLRRDFGPAGRRQTPGRAGGPKNGTCATRCRKGIGRETGPRSEHH